MTLSASEYLLGSLELAVIVAALAFVGWRLRRLLLPDWAGAPARLVEVVVATVALILIAELLGTFGAFADAPMLIASAAAAGAVAFLGPRIEAGRAARPAETPPAPPASRIAWTCAAVAVAAVAAAWMVPTLQALAGGMDRADTLWYHMPLAAKWAQTGDLGRIDHFDPIFFAAYYPANSEVFHAVPILAYGRDIVSPLVNLGFLAIGLLAAYCVGRPYGLGPHSLIGGAIALGSQQLVEFQAGEALNDITGVAYLLAAVAILINASTSGREREVPPAPATGGEGMSPRSRTPGPEVAGGMPCPAEPGTPGPEVAGDSSSPSETRAGRRVSSPTPVTAGSVAALAIAGLAAGVAAGTKLSFLAPTAALAIGLFVIERGARVRSFLWFAVPAALAGGYWYVRNAVAVGNPLPFTPWGPLGLPSPEREFELREPFAVAHYLTDFDVWQDWFFPGLDNSFGFLWPLVIAAFVGAGALALWRGSSPLIRMLGAVVLFTAIAYVFTPLTAAGEEGEPIAFEWNVRYIAPAAAIGLALLPVLIARGRPSARARQLTLGFLSVLLVATVVSLVQWEQGHVKGAVATGIGVLAAFAAIAWLRDRNLLGPLAPTWVAAGLGGLILIGALGAGWWEQRHYLERRYENLSPQLKLAEAVRWARGLEDAKVAVGGVRGVFNQYPFYGTDLSNEVQWLGVEGDEGAFLRIADCEGWRTALADGGYTHVVTTYDPFNPGTLTDTKEALWTREDPASREVLRDGPVSVFRLDGPPDPELCGDLPDLSPAELNGDSVNVEPTANQPPARYERSSG